MAIINDNFQMDYIPARICEGKELLIKYYAWDPKEGKKKRKVMRFNHMIGKYSKRDIMRMMNKAVADINIKLELGKNPNIEADMPKAYSKLSDAIDILMLLLQFELWNWVKIWQYNVCYYLSIMV